MPAMRCSMRKIREVLKLKYARGLSSREIALACSIGRIAVGEYLQRASKAGITWPIDLDDDKLEQMLFVRWLPRKNTADSRLDSSPDRVETKGSEPCSSLAGVQGCPRAISTLSFVNST